MNIAVCKSNKRISVERSIFKYFGKRLFKNNYDWAQKFTTFMDKFGLAYESVYIDDNQWIEKIESFDVIIWKPEFMGVRSTQILKEKIYFMQYIMGKRVFPNYETIWHFDSKIAQSYFFKYKKIKTPKTFVSFDYNDVVDNSNKLVYPIVIKESSGAGSSGVRLIKSYKNMIKYINRRFIWENLLSRKLSQRLFDRFGQIYFQEFLVNNKADLRITVIGSKYAFGFWRKNREGDFRASGSGKVDYQSEIPQNIVEYCVQISKNNNFDSMAYDILFKDDEFLIVEMSYGYNETAIFSSKGYYEFDQKGSICKFTSGNYWPQELWVKWILENLSEN